MSNQMAAENPLGFEKIPKLLSKFAVPSVVAMLVSALYNIVDQIFIGQYVGTLGNAATNVAFPVTTICIAISVLCGVGGASCFSIELGRKHNDAAKDCVGNALFAALVMSVAYAVLAGIFVRPMLAFFGGSGSTLDYAVNYCNYVVFGIPFLVLGNVLSNFIRADGNPKFSMICMISGGIINIILDAVLVPLGGVEWGMQGAALATAISQLISFIVAASYIRRFKTVDFKLSKVKLSIKRIYKIFSLGLSNCVNQLAILVVQITMTNQLTKYGILAYGEALAHIPQAAFGVVIKVNSMLISFFVGMAQGSQPIVGFNYGADKQSRSKQTFTLSAAICLLVASIGFLIFQTCPEAVISIFGSGDAEYNAFAVKTMRIFLSMIMLNGIQMTISNYFSAIGKPIKGVILSLTRQVIFIVPLMIILPIFYGLDGLLLAAPITDFISFILALVLILVEFRRPEYMNR